jgi:HEPN domain-containing protein
MTTNRTHFAHRIDKVDEAGGALEHLAGAEDSGLADAVYRAARKRWPDDAIMLRHEARVIRDSRQETPPEAADDQIDRRAPLGYLNYAASYHAAADLVYSEEIEATHPDAPATFLYCQAAELYLKAFLRLKGDSSTRLWWMRHDLGRLASRAEKRGLRLGEAERTVLGWMAATKAWENARYLKTGPSSRLRGSLIPNGCSTLKATVVEEFRRAGQPIIAPRLKRPFHDIFASWRNGADAG